jgi:DNA-binding beta-propeller fold protein YncE
LDDRVDRGYDIRMPTPSNRTSNPINIPNRGGTLLNRRCLLAGAACSWLCGCVPNRSNSVGHAVDLILGKRGLSEGRFQKPRALTIGPDDEVYVIDKTARIQVFDRNGEFLRGWSAPEAANGKPTGVSFDPVTNTLMVADTHYFRFLFYTPQGEWLEDRTIGGVNGPEPGQFGWVTDIVRAPSGILYLAEYGEYDRIYKYSADGQYIDRFGENGDGPLQFSRPQSLAVDDDGLLWIADSCNHRIQVVDWREDKPRSVEILGGLGTEPGQLQFPYGMTLLSKNRLLVSEFGNHRVQCWRRSGEPLSSWGSAGNLPGQLNQPWAVAVDSKERVYVVDSGNNRVQRYWIN